MSREGKEVRLTRRHRRGTPGDLVNLVVPRGIVEAPAEFDRLAAARFALNIADVQEVVRTALGGMRVAMTVEGLELINVAVIEAEGPLSFDGDIRLRRLERVARLMLENLRE